MIKSAMFQISSETPLIIFKFSHIVIDAISTRSTNHINRFRRRNSGIGRNSTIRKIWSFRPRIRCEIHQFGFSLTTIVSWKVRATSDQSFTFVISKSSRAIMWIFWWFKLVVVLTVKTRFDYMTEVFVLTLTCDMFSYGHHRSKEEFSLKMCYMSDFRK